MTDSLKFWLSRLIEGVNTEEIGIEPADLDLAELETGKLDRIELSLTMVRTREDVLVSGFAVSAVRQDCVRCLNTKRTPIKASVEVLVRPLDSRTDHRGGRGRDTEKEMSEAQALKDNPPEGILYHSGESFSLADEVRQAVLVEIPSDPVCDRDCRGLCSVCGINLNTATCSCYKSDGGDPRWDALQRLKDEVKEPRTD